MPAQYGLYVKLAAWSGFLGDPDARVAPREVDRFRRLHGYWAPEWEAAGGELADGGEEGFNLGRTKIAAFIGASNRDEVVFTKNASEALNLVARVLGDAGRVTADTDSSAF